MKIQSLIVSAFAAVAVAAPHPTVIESIDADALPALMARASDTSDDLKNGACKEVTFIYARGSTESGNMGFIVGPQVCTALKALLGPAKVACQGVGSPYNAGLIENFLPKSTSPEAIGAATTLFNLAHTKCPNTKVVAGGYSQGTAVVGNSIQELDAAVVAQIKGVVLFGFTRNKQDGGRIPNYPTDQTKVICADGDEVCNGTLLITPAHLSYGNYAVPAALFLAS
ncbi:hypothetical protein V498_10233, partial [Pseudogymnoascus sp. VKM F-4517 (FW-2822)]